MSIAKYNLVIVIALFCAIMPSCSLNPEEKDTKPIEVIFTDSNFEALIREELEIPERDITNQDMWKIKTLIGVGRNISNITGIEYCSGLQLLKIRDNNISDIGPLRDLILINYLDLQQNQIVDIEPLVDNTGIGLGDDIIYIYENPLSNESILQYKPQLQARGVKFYSDADISGPGEIKFVDDNFETVIREYLNQSTGPILTTDVESITNIWANNRNIQNIYGIEFCTNLDTLNLRENSISDLLPLALLENMTILNVNNNKINDISPLTRLTDLVSLDLGNNDIYLINSLSNINELSYLILGYNKIEDISPLSGLSELKYLALNSNPIIDLLPISNLDSLNTLELIDLEQIDLSDINALKLQTLYLTNTPVQNLDPIAEMHELEFLFMKNCSLTEIDSIVSLPKLGKLYLNDNNIIDISPLEKMYNLFELELGNNNITDILPLVNNYGLGGGQDYVFLYNNPLNEISINTYIPQLQNRGVVITF